MSLIMSTGWIYLYSSHDIHFQNLFSYRLFTYLRDTLGLMVKNWTSIVGKLLVSAKSTETLQQVFYFVVRASSFVDKSY